jgi:hypothetical protein
VGIYAYDEEYIWFPTKAYLTIWHLVHVWLLQVCPDKAKHVSKRDVQLFWRNHATKRLLPLWESLSPIKPPPEFVRPLAACAALSLRGDVALELRDHIEKHLVTKGLLRLDANGRAKYEGKRSTGGFSETSLWAEIFASFKACHSKTFQRVETADKLFNLFTEKQDLWLGHWTLALQATTTKTTTDYSPTKARAQASHPRGGCAPDHESAPKIGTHKMKAVTSVAQRTREIWREIAEGKGLIATQPCTNCLRRDKTCWLHVDDKSGKCLDCMRGVVGEMKVRDCARSRGIMDEVFAIRPYRPLMVVLQQQQASRPIDETSSHKIPAGVVKRRQQDRERSMI